MQVRILDLDGALDTQAGVRSLPELIHWPLREWGPSVRLACSFGAFRRFEAALARWAGEEKETGPIFTCYGSGDFHHVSLALLRRLRTPCNVLVVDNHPDWMRGVPLLHCGTWLHHAARLPHVERVFHVGGDVDFDNGYRWLAPWPELRSGKITVFPAYRGFRRGHWQGVPNEPVRPGQQARVTLNGLEALLAPHAATLAARPLYISVDKDVLIPQDAIVNWDSGHLTLDELRTILEVFLRFSEGKLAGMDTTGDWSPVRVQGALRSILERTEHPELQVDPAQAAQCNERVNEVLLDTARNAACLATSICERD
jgi:hypothetical protein